MRSITIYISHFSDIYDIYIETMYYNMKQIIRLAESDIHRIVKESVKRILKENQNNYRGIELQPWMTRQQWKELVDQALDVDGWSAEEVQMAVNGINQPKW